MNDKYVANWTSALFTPLFFIFLVGFLGLLLGSIEIKRVSLGHAGVLIMAIILGVIYNACANDNDIVSYKLYNKEIAFWNSSVKSTYSFVSNLGTDLFVTAVGLIAGPKFFRSFNCKMVGYILMSVIIVLLDVGITILITFLDKDMDIAMATGILSGSLTTTPGYSSAKEAAESFNEDYANEVTAGHGIGYIYGILGVVIFVQIMPLILKVDIEKEKQNFIAANQIDIPQYEGKLINIDKQGFFIFFLTCFLGIFVGSIKIPISSTSYFSFGASGGTLIMGLVIGHFGHCGPINLSVPKTTLNFLRELGLILFLIGSGIPGGVNFGKYVKGIYFLYGIIMTTIPIIVGFIFGHFVFKFSIFNNLGSITGAMTSTPALGSLIGVAGTDEVSSAYAASYPVALVLLVISSNLMVLVGLD